MPSPFFRVAVSACLWLVAVGVVWAPTTRGEDWPTPRHDWRRSGVTPAAPRFPRLRRLWSWRSPSPPRTAWPGPAKWDAYANLRKLMWMRDYDAAFHPIVAAGRVYCTSSVDDRLRCFSLADGKLLWERLADAPLHTPPSYHDGRVYIGGDDGFVRCYRAGDGELLWKFAPPAARNQEWIVHNGRLISRWPCRTSIVVHHGTVYCGFALLPWQPAFLCALDARTGKPEGDGRFVVQLDGDTLEGPMALVDSVLVACRGRIEPALFESATGKRTGPLHKSSGGGSFLTVDTENRLWHGPGNKTGWLTRSQLPSGKKTAARKGAQAAVFTADRSIFADHGKVSARASDDQIVWEQTLSGVCELVVAGDCVVGGGRDRVAVWALADGRPVWQADITGTARGLAVVDRALIVATDRGEIICFAEDGGEGTDRVATDSRPETSTAVASGDPVPSFDPPAKTVPQSPIAKQSPVHQWDFRTGMEAFAVRRGLPRAEDFVPDLAGQLAGYVRGSRSIWRGAGIEALLLDGSTYVELTDRLAPPPFPSRAITAEAWVSVDKPMKWGGIVGAIRDNGSDEQGWLLGFQERYFSFAVRSTEGNGRLTYLKASRPFQTGRWYHVVGTYDGKTQRLFVNGQLLAESKTQQGSIQYPPSGWATIGSYRDENEDFRLTGKIDQVAIFNRALSPQEVNARYQARIQLYPRPVELSAGPWVTFPAPGEAIIGWETDQPTAGRVRVMHANGSVVVLKAETAGRRRKVWLKNLEPFEQIEYSIEVPRGEGTGVAGPYPLDLAFNYRLPPVDADGYSQQDASWAQAIRSQTGFRGGLIAVVGRLPATRLPALAGHPRTYVRHIVGHRDPQQSFRKQLAGIPGYGVRFSTRTLPRSDWHCWPRDTVNLLLVTGSEKLNHREIDELRHWVEPGGVLLLGSTNTPVSQEQRWRRIDVGSETYWMWRRPLPEGTGEWSHLYSSADNTGYTGETLQGARSVDDLRARWIGLPGPGAQADRTGRKPSPLAISGLLFVQGLNRIVALDAYNGTIRWELEVPHWARFNMPRDCGNWCADKEFVYLAVRDRCWVIDQATGKLVRMDAVRRPPDSTQRFAWGYVGRTGDVLLGTTVAEDAVFREYWGGFGWYDARTGEQTAKVCADRLFALDARTGELRWEYDRGVIMQASISARDDRLYFVESLSEEVKQSSLRRLNDNRFWESLRMVCLERDSGRLLWERTLESPPGRVAFLMSVGPKQVISVASDNGLFHVRTFDSQSGKPLWQATAEWPGGKAGDHGKALSRPAIVGDRVFVRPSVFSLSDGKKLPMTLPYGKCGTFSCATDMFFYRHTIVSAWSPGSGKLKGWNRLRPDCWLSTIPALGMVLSPEAGGGCSCGYWYEASLGFSPVAGLALGESD